jgi:beta-N-acetylhexosaminidase
MKAASAAFGIPEAAVLSVIAGTDLLCLGRDTDEAMYHAVRSALADAVTSGRLPAQRLEEAAARVAGLRARLAADRDVSGIPADGAVGAGDGIGLVAARRALRRSGPVPGPLTDPLVVEVEPEENIAAGRFPWGFEPWADVLRVDVAAGDGAGPTGAGLTGAGLTGTAASGILAASAGRSLVLAVRDARDVLPLLEELIKVRPDTVLVEMGVPAWAPPAKVSYLATYGASRACAQAAAEALGLA